MTTRVRVRFPPGNTCTLRCRQIQYLITAFLLDVERPCSEYVIGQHMRQVTPKASTNEVLATLRVMKECGLVEKTEVQESRYVQHGQRPIVTWSAAWQLTGDEA